MMQKQYAATADGAALSRLMIGALLLLLVCARIAVPVTTKEVEVNSWDQFKMAFESSDVDGITVTGNFDVPNRWELIDVKQNYHPPN